MNNSSKSSYTYYDLEEFLADYGSTFGLDAFSLYPFTIVSLSGFVLNVFSWLVFLDAEFNEIPLKKYMRVYTSTNSILCFFSDIKLCLQHQSVQLVGKLFLGASLHQLCMCAGV
jgi:hypothetical protein